LVSFQQTTKEFIKIISSRPSLSLKSIQKLVYHTVDSTNGASDIELQRVLNIRIATLLPKNLCLEIIRWKQENLHSRHVLSEIGGVDFHIGLDDDDDNPDSEVDKITPIVAKHCWYTKGRKENSDPYMSTRKKPSVVIQGKLK